MGVSFEQAYTTLPTAITTLFRADHSVRSVGITRLENGFGFRAVRNAAEIKPLAADIIPVEQVHDVPVVFANAPGEVEALVLVTHSGPASPQSSSTIPEAHRHRPLVSGLMIQNFDDDDEQGVIAGGHMTVGTLGCFVRLDTGDVAILSNNHVVAGNNRGKKGTHRILQPGGGLFQPGDHIATLTDFASLDTSPPGSSPDDGTAILNTIDAGVATIRRNTKYTAGYLPLRGLGVPHATASGQLGDHVFKVGWKTGLTRGEVVDIVTTVGPIRYGHGFCWFSDVMVIEGDKGSTFSDKGDSGSLIVCETGEAIGLLFAGNGLQTYACSITTVLHYFNCTLL